MASVYIFVLLISMAVTVMCQEGEACRQLEFRSHLFYQGKRLKNHLIRTEHSVSKDFCGPLCFMEPNCVSFNMHVISGNPSVINCELNNSTHFEHPEHLEPASDYHYRGSENACTEKPCGVNGICQAGFTEKGYRCVCTDGFTGQDCMTDIDECTEDTHNCPDNANCVNTHGSYNCSCKLGYTGDGLNCTDINECTASVNPCDVVVNSTCNNTYGSYICQCSDGYVNNGSSCEDIDECAGPGDPCNTDVNSACHNTNGAYICQCINGYVKSSSGDVCEVDLCQNYQTLTDAKRKVTYTSSTSECDYTLSGWYRFEGAAGTKMATTCPPMSSCDANFPGWLDGSHPTVDEGAVTRRVCFNRGNCCDNSINTQVKNCSSYYIYKLIPVTVCNTRYCGAD